MNARGVNEMPGLVRGHGLTQPDDDGKLSSTRTRRISRAEPSLERRTNGS